MKRPTNLEVIVTSAEEAIAAQKGGADRLELVRDLDTGGLTPDWETAREVTEAVAIPVRVMLRENASMQVANGQELDVLRNAADRLVKLPIDGLVMGWIDNAGEVDVTSLAAVLNATSSCKVTFHRSFEHLQDPFAGLTVLKSFPQIDKILTGGGTGSWAERKSRLRSWRAVAAPEIGILVGGGLSESEVRELMANAEFPEVHVGRAARTPAENNGTVDMAKIALLKSRRGG